MNNKKIKPEAENKTEVTKKSRDSKIDIRINLLSQVAKQMKVVGVIVFFLSLPLAFSLLHTGPRESASYPAEPVPEEAVSQEAEACLMGGGEWKEFPNACVDSCPNQIGDSICAQVVTSGCDCGQYECWDGEKCALNP